LNFKREGVTQLKPFTSTKVESLKAKVDTYMVSKGKSDSQPKCTHDVKCFRYQGLDHYTLECPNKRIMVIRDNEDVEPESDIIDCKDMPPLKDCIDEEIACPVEGEALAIKRTLLVQVKEDDIDQQRENIFHTYCHIQNKVCKWRTSFICIVMCKTRCVI
jgi:hypothetical protein